VVFPDFQPMRVSEESVCIYLFRQNPVFTSLHLRSPDSCRTASKELKEAQAFLLSSNLSPTLPLSCISAFLTSLFVLFSQCSIYSLLMQEGEAKSDHIKKLGPLSSKVFQTDDCMMTDKKHIFIFSKIFEIFYANMTKNNIVS
jgi:hypothetical protein